MTTQTFNITDDAYVSAGAVSTNTGSSNSVYFGLSGVYPMYGFFKLPAPTLGSGESVTSTKLVLTIANSAMAGETVEIYSVGAAWTEGTLTYNNMPTLTLAKTLTLPSAAVGTTFELDISDVDTTNGVALSINSPFRSVHSAEATTAAYRPKVVYETNVQIITDDALVTTFNTEGNYGATTSLSLGNNGTYDYLTLLKLPSPTLRPGEVVVGAKIVLVASSGKDAGSVTVSTNNASWDEMTLTWGNKPATTFVKTVDVPKYSQFATVEIDVTECYDAEHGITLNGVDKQYQFYSSENTAESRWPKVVYELSTAPVGVDAGYVAEPMTATALMTNTGVSATSPDRTISAQPMTAAVAMPGGSTTSNVETSPITDDIGMYNGQPVGSAGANTQYVQYDTYLNWTAPSLTINEGDIVTKTLTMFAAASNSARNVNLYSLDSAFVEGQALPSRTFVRGAWVPARAQDQKVTIDISDIDTTNGVVLVLGNAAYYSSEASDPALRPYVTTSVTSPVVINFAAGPATAQASMPTASVSAGANLSLGSTPMTATAEFVDPSVDILVGVFAESMDAYASMPNSNFAMPVNIFPEVMTATAESTDATVDVEKGVIIKPTPLKSTSRWIKPALVNDLPVTVNEAEDKYAQLVLAQGPSRWFRLNDLGTIAVDRMGATRTAEYVGVQTGLFDAPEGRHSVYFDGNSYIRQIEGGNEAGNRRNTLEFSFRTTKANQFLMVTDDERSGSLYNTAQPPRELYLQDGRIGYRIYTLGSTGLPSYAAVTYEFTGFKNLADGEWHTVSIVSNISDGQSGTQYGVDIYVDGKFEVRRASGINRAVGWTGFPDYIGSRPNISPSLNFVGDMTEVSVTLMVTADQIAQRFYAFMGWNPIAAGGMEAFAFTPAGHKGRGNQKRALYLFWEDTVDKYNFGGGNATNKQNYDPLFQNFRSEGTFDLHEYKVFSVKVRGNSRDLVYDQPTLLDLERDVDIDDYDLIMFGDWPDESHEDDYYKMIYPNYVNDKERLLRQLRDANDDGTGLLVTHPRLAADLGIIDRVEAIPSLKGVGNYGSAVKFPWNISADSGITQRGSRGGYGTGEPMNTDPTYLEFKARFYGDTDYNNRFRVRAKIEGLTDIPSWMMKDAITQRDLDVWGESIVAWNLIDRREGLQIGDEFLFNGTNPAMQDWSENSYQGLRLGRPYGYYAVPLENVKAGTVVTTFGATHWFGKQEVENPYKDYATTIAVQPGEMLAGRPVGGRIFVSFTESPFMLGKPLLVDILPGSEWDDGTAVWPNLYLPDTPAQRDWELSTTRLTLRNTSVGGTITETTVTMPDGSTAVTRNAGSGFIIANGYPLFKRAAVQSWDMTLRGMWWAGRSEKAAQGDKRVGTEAIKATAEMPEPTVTAQRDGGYNAQAMTGLAQMTRVAESTVGDAEVRMLPMTARAEFTGFSRVVSAGPMEATAEFVENFDVVHATGEQVVLTLHGVDTTLYLKEEA